jgi:hypothetical protein
LKKLLLLPLLIVTCFCFAQDAKPNKIGLIGDFVGILTFAGLLEGNRYFTLYCEDLKSEVKFISGLGIKNPPNIDNGRFSYLINNMDINYPFIPYVMRVKAKSVLRFDDTDDNIANQYKIVWTPIKITLISTTSSMPK